MLTFNNVWTKKYLARKGPVKVFGKDVDRRERLSDDEAVAWFDAVWADGLAQAVEDADACDSSCALRKLRGRAIGFVRREDAEHREFVLEGCLCIAQLIEPDVCDQLWFVFSSSGGDPRGLYLKFRTMAEREEFDDLARRLGRAPSDLAEYIINSFLKSAGRRVLLPRPKYPPGQA